MNGWHAKGNGREATGFAGAITAGPDKCFITTTPLFGDSSGQYMTHLFAQIDRQLDAVELPNDLEEVKEAAQRGECFVCAAQHREAVTQAAAEMTKHYEVFDRAAIDLTREYCAERLEGEEGVTWVMFPRGAFSRPTPIFDVAIRHKGAILLGAGYNHWHEVLREYALTKVEMLVPAADGMFVRTKVIVIRRAGAGFDPGDEYLVVGDQILKAGHDHRGPVPTVGSHGGLAWSPSRDFVNGTFHPLTEVNAELQKVIERLRAYAAKVKES